VETVAYGAPVRASGEGGSVGARDAACGTGGGDVAETLVVGRLTVTAVLLALQQQYKATAAITRTTVTLAAIAARDMNW